MPAKHAGVSAVLFIEEIFSDGLTKDHLSLDDAVTFTHELGLDTIIETHTMEGLDNISKTNCDIIGINNRNLRTFETNIETTPKLLKEFSRRRSYRGVSAFDERERVQQPRGFAKSQSALAIGKVTAARRFPDRNIHHAVSQHRIESSGICGGIE